MSLEELVERGMDPFEALKEEGIHDQLERDVTIFYLGGTIMSQYTRKGFREQLKGAIETELRRKYRDMFGTDGHELKMVEMLRDETTEHLPVDRAIDVNQLGKFYSGLLKDFFDKKDISYSVSKPFSEALAEAVSTVYEEHNKIRSELKSLVEQIPFVNAKIGEIKNPSGEPLPLKDSSHYSKEELLIIASQIAREAEKNGVVIFYGTDTMQGLAEMVNNIGNQTIRHNVAFAGSMSNLDDIYFKDLLSDMRKTGEIKSKKDQSAKDNPREIVQTAAFMAAYGPSAVTIAFPEGHVLHSRSDPVGVWNQRHAEGWERLRGAVYLGMKVKQYGDDTDYKKHRSDNPVEYDEGSVLDFRTHERNSRWLKDVILKKNGDVKERIIKHLQSIIRYPREPYKGSLDKIPDYGRGKKGFTMKLPHVGHERQVLEDKLFDDAPEIGDAGDLAEHVRGLVEYDIKQGRFVGPVIPGFAFAEMLRRDEEKRGDHIGSDEWKETLKTYLFRTGLRSLTLSGKIADFWEAYSNKPSDDMDFSKIDHIQAWSESYGKNEMVVSKLGKRSRMVMIKGTGDSGVPETYYRYLERMKKKGVPVVILSGSPGEAAGPIYRKEIYDRKLAIFGGTMSEWEMLPRLARLNSESSRELMKDLYRVADKMYGEKFADEVQMDTYRQLLQGTHYPQYPHHHPVAGEDTGDAINVRKRIEKDWKIETRFDLLGGLHSKQAILSAWLHNVTRRIVFNPSNIVRVSSLYDVLEKHIDYARSEYA